MKLLYIMKQTLTWIIIALIIGGGFFAYVLNNRVPNTNTTGDTNVVDTSLSKYDGFAQCLAQKKVTMYGAVWCSHCQNQKKEFGSSFKYVNYVECPENTKLCTEKGIEGFPTWITADGQKLVGEQLLEALASTTGCVLPQ